jgi:DNA-binding NarL/FixJ family response regulator
MISDVMIPSAVIRVLVVDDHPVVRHGVSLMLKTHADIDVVAAVGSADLAVEAVAELHPQVVLMDLSMPGRDGPSATREIVARFPEVAVVALTSFSDEDRVMEALNAGAVGYMLKDSEPAELVEAVRAAARGESPLHPKAARVALTHRPTPTDEVVTEREREVLLLVARGHTNRQIASRLGITERTVKGHLTNIFSRIGVSDRTSAALWAERNLGG